MDSEQISESNLRSEGDVGASLMSGSAALIDQEFEDYKNEFIRFSDTLPEITFVNKLDGAFTLFNQRWFEFTGQNRWVPIDPMRAFEANDLAHFTKTLRNARNSLEPFEAQLRVLDLNGATTVFAVKTSPLYRLNQKTAMGWVSVAVKTRLPTLTVGKSFSDHEILEIVLQGTSETFCLLDRKWRYVTVNAAWLETVHLEKAPLGEYIWEVFPQLIDTPLYTAFHECMDESKPIRLEFYSTAAKRWLEVRAYPISDGLVYFLTDVHAKKIAEDELKKSRDQLSVILDGIGAGVVAYDEKGSYVFANDAAARLAGFSSVFEFMNSGLSYQERISDLCDEEGASLTPDMLPSRQILLGKKDPKELAIQFRNRSTHQVRWALLKSQGIYDESDKLQMVISIFQDITERKKSQLERETLFKKVVTERARLEAVFKQVEIGLLILDRDTNDVKFINSQVEKIWRRPIPRDSHSRFHDFHAFTLDGAAVGPEEWPSRRAIKDRKSHDEELEIVRGDGTHGYARFTASPIQAPNGDFLATLVTIQDVTHIRHQERAARFLDEASRLLSSSLDYEETLKSVAQLAVPKLGDLCTISILESQTLHRIAIAGRDPEIVKLVTEIREKFPIDLAAKIGVAQVLKSGEALLTPDFTAEVARSVSYNAEHASLIKKLNINSVLVVPIKGRERTHGVITLMTNRAGRKLEETDLKIALEIGSRAGMAIDNARLFHEAQAAIRLRDEFMTLASHELKTPLTSMMLQSQILRRELGLGEGKSTTKDRITKLVQQTDRGLQQLSRLVGDMLDIARIRSGRLHVQLELGDLSALVREIVDRFSSQFENAGINVLLSAVSSLPVHFDTYRMEQVLTNLFVNAIRYAPGAPLRIIVDSTETNTARIRVSDHGPGIATANRERVFERFERLVGPNDPSGLGVGLYICRQIIEAHGGRIFIEDAPPPGTSFVVEIPNR